MKILCLGDVVGRASVDFLERRLWGVRSGLGADMVVANGENASDGNGLLPADADSLFSAGVDVVTSGNHIFRRRELYPYLDEHEAVLRPGNYPPSSPGKGYTLFDNGACSVLVINLLGQVFLEPLSCPFREADRLLAEFRDVKIKLIDFHAEATAEKKALALHLCGRVTAVVGTHTHVQTSDACILEGGTGFITDLGMTGPVDSVLGVAKEQVLQKFLTKMPVQFQPAGGEIRIQGVLLDVDGKSGRTVGIQTISLL